MARCVYIVDDDDAVRASLHSLLSIQGGMLVWSFRSGNAFLERAAELDPGVVLLDFVMPGVTGVDVLTALREIEAPKFSVVMLTGEGTVALAVEAMKLGASDFIEQPYEAQKLLDSIEVAQQRLEDTSAATAHAERARARIEGLSPRERDVLVGLIEGRANKVIAFQLEISPRTVEIYRANLMSKLGVRSLPEALRIAFAAGMIALR